jgi:asparagine synthase (glutamine-hydrolysing)
MCRIVGRVLRDGKNNFVEGLSLMLRSVAHGGPDDEGTYFDEKVALGHRRLSIIDLSKGGHQPMLTEAKDIVISFNGEIYNYQELKKELEADGITFQTKTDTEVILKAYQKWDTHAFDKLEGIFAFALFDKEKELFFLVRDHIGVKPLYYFLDEKELLFSSEVRAFKALRADWKENEDWKVLFLAFGSIPHPYTTLSNVFQLRPGSYIRLNVRDFSHQIVSYYRFDNREYSIDTSSNALALMQLSTLKAVQKNLIADAPLGIFLSGGVDSSLLTLLADQLLKEVKTISINFDDSSYDEYPFQKLVLEKTQNVEHTSHRVTEHMFWDHLNDIWRAMDQPSVDGVNAYFAARCAKNDGIKAVLSGLGADEIFGGYASFTRIKWMRWIRQLPVKKIIAKVLSLIKKSWGRLVYLNLPGAIGDYLFLRGIHTPDEIATLLKIPQSNVWDVLDKVPFDMPTKMNDVEYASLLEARIYMTNQLLKDTDYMSMWHGVEVRVPFLDIELLRKVHTIPSSIRYNDLWPKHLLTAANHNILPRKIIFRNKKGFTFPFVVWMKRSPMRLENLFPKGKEASSVLKEFKNGRCHWSKCWSLAVLQQYK